MWTRSITLVTSRSPQHEPFLERFCALDPKVRIFTLKPQTLTFQPKALKPLSPKPKSYINPHTLNPYRSLCLEDPLQDPPNLSGFLPGSLGGGGGLGGWVDAERIACTTQERVLGFTGLGFQVLGFSGLGF